MSKFRKNIKKTHSDSKPNDYYQEMCWECGNKKYKEVNKLGCVTVSLGICPSCGKKTYLVPALDWMHRENINSMFD